MLLLVTAFSGNYTLTLFSEALTNTNLSLKFLFDFKRGGSEPESPRSL